jgi:hypothetical protein
MTDPARYFVHRWNPDKTIDSICSVCGLTACKESTLALAQDCEKRHRCPDWAVGRFNGGLGRIVSQTSNT